MVIAEVWINLVGVLAFVYFVHWLSHKQDDIVQTVDDNTVTIEDYTVRL